MLKICITCNKEKPIQSFQSRGTTRRATCRSCRRKNSYANNPNRNNKLKAIQYLGGKCQNQNCPLKHLEPLDPVLLDFHHRDQTTKLIEVSRLFKKRAIITWAKLQNELDKCSLLCCVCHRLLHKDQ